MTDLLQYVHLTTSGQTTTMAGAGSHSGLVAVNVNTGAASAVLTITDAAGTNTIAVVNCAAVTSLQYLGVRVAGGLKFALTGGNADVTISFH